MRTFWIALFLALSLNMVYSSSTQAQCQRAVIKKQGTEALKPYLFELVAFTEVNTDESQPIEANFTVYSRERYRLVTMLSGFPEPVEVNLYDHKRNLIYTTEEGTDQSVDKFEFEARETAEYVIEFKFPPTREDFVGIGCIAFMLGYQ